MTAGQPHPTAPNERLWREELPTGRFGGPPPPATARTSPMLAAQHRADLEQAISTWSYSSHVQRAAEERPAAPAPTRRRHLTVVPDHDRTEEAAA